jgi:hypothetical protein
LQPFIDANLRSKMVVIKGIDSPRMQEWLGDKHGAGMLAVIAPPVPDQGLRSWPIIPGYDEQTINDSNGKFFSAPAPSIDQELLFNLPSLRGATIPSLQLGSSLQSMKGTGDHCLRVISYAGFNQPLWPECRPDVAFANIFGVAATGHDSASVARARARRKSVLDFVAADLSGLRARVPPSQYQKLDSHLTAVRGLERGIGEAVDSACARPAVSTPASATDDQRYLQATRDQLKIVKTAFQCDLSRVVSFTFGFGNSALHFANILPGGLHDTGGHHDISHNGGTDFLTAQEAIDRFYSQATASLLADMDSMVESDGSTLLDNTVVVYFNEVSNGCAHDLRDLPILLFGGKTLGLAGGSYLSMANDRRTMADVWVETFKRLGYAKLRYGDAAWNRGPIPGLYTT